MERRIDHLALRLGYAVLKGTWGALCIAGFVGYLYFLRWVFEFGEATGFGAWLAFPLSMAIPLVVMLGGAHGAHLVWKRWLS